MGMSTYTHKPQYSPKWYQKINPLWWFGNMSEPTPPDWYRPLEPYWRRYCLWFLRNPLWNFCSFVIGISDKQFERIGKQPQNMFLNGTDGWNYAYCAWKIPLPFVSYVKGKFQFYLGWRQTGSFGFACRLEKYK